MTAPGGVVAVIPARQGSKGLPGKNVRPFAGLPLIVHSILFARLCPDIARLVVSTDSEAIAAVARQYQADVPFLRPGELSKDDTPLWPVLRQALDATESLDGRQYEFIVLLDPTSPARQPQDLEAALKRLKETPEADGIVGASRPDFNPIWHCVVERDGWMSYLVDQGVTYSRRQDVPPVYRINGGLYVWRTSFVRREARGWQGYGRHLIFETPEYRAMSIDDLREFERAELLVKSGFIRLPWLEPSQVQA